MKNRFSIGDVLKPIDGSMCVTYEEQNAVAIRITDINSDGNYFYVILSKEGTVLGGCSHCFKDDNLTLVNKTLNTLQVGDYVKNKYGDYRRVLAVLSRSDEDGLCVYVLSGDGKKYSDNIAKAYSTWTVYDLKRLGYSIEEPTPETVEELTIEEAEKLLGKKIKIKK